MNKPAFIQTVTAAGDAYVDYVGKHSGKKKYFIVTLNFKTPYVRDIYFAKYGTEPPTLKQLENDKSNKILAFCWDLNDFKSINIETVVKVTPLADVMDGIAR